MDARRPTDVEGLYVSPVHPEAAIYAEGIVRDIARRYAVDGIHLDYARYPSDRFDYSRGAIAAVPQLRASRAQRRDPARTRRPRSASICSPILMRSRPNGAAFRVARLTALVRRAAAPRSRASGRTALVSAAAAPDAQDALDHRLQDWGGWLKADLIDAICPMAYTTEPARFAEQIAGVRSVAGDASGLGRHRLLSPVAARKRSTTSRPRAVSAPPA